MTYSNYNSLFRAQAYYPVNFRENNEQNNSAPKIITKPIKTVENAINNTVDTFIKTEEVNEKKDSHKTAIAVGSSVLVLSGIIALLNPKFSGKLINKLKIMSHKAGTKAQKNKGDSFKNKFYNSMSKFWGKIGDIFQFTNTLNAGKDIGFKWICSEEKHFNKVKNKPLKNLLQKTDSAIRMIMSPIHKSITKWFDNISKRTVQMNYKNASKKLDAFEDLVKYYRDKLPIDKQRILDQKLKEAKNAREYFSHSRTMERLNTQETLMINLESDLKPRYKQYANDLLHGNGNRMKLIKDNMSFWAEDLLMPERNRLETEGQNIVNQLIGVKNGNKGKFNEIADILTPYLSKDEAILLGKKLSKADKSLHKANFSETVEYFDKKRDLMLGGAPTDILSGIGMVALSGIAVSTAHSKEERISKTITTGFPAVAGIGTSMALTAMLFSGAKSLIYGAIAGGVFSLMGSGINKYIYPKHNVAQAEPNKEVTNNA